MGRHEGQLMLSVSRLCGFVACAAGKGTRAGKGAVQWYPMAAHSLLVKSVVLLLMLVQREGGCSAVGLHTACLLSPWCCC